MPGSVLNIDLPETTDSWPVWATKTRAAFQAIIDDIEPKVATGAIEESAAHSLNGYAIEDARWLYFRVGNTTDIPPAGVGYKNGDLWATDEAGNQIQITTGGAINIAGSGGFAGDYVSAGAVAYYSDATSRYTFYDGAGDLLANLRGLTFQVASDGADTSRVTLDYTGVVNYSLTLPPSLPAAGAALVMDALGNVAAAGTIGVDQTISNADLILAGTAEIQHPNRTFTTRAAKAYIFTASGSEPSRNSGGALSRGSGAWTSYYQIDPEYVGDTFQSVAVRVNKGDTSTTTVNVYRVGATGSLGAAIATATSALSGDRTITPTAASTLAAGQNFIVEVIFTASTNIVYCMDPTYSRA